MNKTIIVYALATITAAILLGGVYLTITYAPSAVVLPISVAVLIFLVIKTLSFPIEEWMENRFPDKNETPDPGASVLKNLKAPVRFSKRTSLYDAIMETSYCYYSGSGSRVYAYMPKWFEIDQSTGDIIMHDLDSIPDDLYQAIFKDREPISDK